jgi:hypothetical protein
MKYICALLVEIKKTFVSVIFPERYNLQAFLKY